jgi:hypothetical protein
MFVYDEQKLVQRQKQKVNSAERCVDQCDVEQGNFMLFYMFIPRMSNSNNPFVVNHALPDED